MRFTYNVQRYVNTGLQRVLGSVRAVRNVFKKKNCGASPVTAKPVITERMLLDHAARLLGLP